VWTSTNGLSGIPAFSAETESSGTVYSTFTITPATDIHNGTYTLTVADANGCSKVETSQLIVYPSTIYVSTTGNDTYGDGREGNPLRTIQKANDVAIAENTIMVKAGTYNESPVITKELSVHATGSPVLGTGFYFIYGTGSEITWGSGWPTSVWNNVGVNSDGTILTAYNQVNGGSNNTLWIIGNHNMPGLTVAKQIAIRGATSSAQVPTYEDCNINPPTVLTHTPGSGDVSLFTMTGSVTKSLRDLELRIPNGSRFIEIANGSSGDVSSTENVVYKWVNNSGSPSSYRRMFGLTNANHSGGTEKFDVAKLINDAEESTNGYGSGRVKYGNNGPLSLDNLVVGWKAEDAEGSADVNDYGVGALPPMTTAEPRLLGSSWTTRRATLKTTSAQFNNKYFMSFNGSNNYLDANTNSDINSGKAKTLFVVFAPVKGLADQVIYKHGDNQKGMSVVQLANGDISLNIYEDTDNTVGNLTHESWIFEDNGNFNDNDVLIAQIYFNGASSDKRVGASLHKASARILELNHGVTPTGYLGSGDFSPDTLKTPAVISAANPVSIGCRTGSYYYGSWNGATVTDNSLVATSGRGLWFKGKFAEAIMMNTADVATRDAAYCYLRNKYYDGNQDVENGLLKDGDVIAGDEVAFDPSIDVFPNPAETIVSLEVNVPYAGNALVTIKDALGRTVATIFDGPVSDNTTLSLQADVRNLMSGAYFVNVVGAREVISTTPLMIRR
jgi:hypothetical protein